MSTKGMKFPNRKRPFPFSEEHRRNMSMARKGKPNGLLGKKATKETRMKMSKSHAGEKSHLWKGGVTNPNLKIRHNIENRLWKEAVKNRDGHACIWCGSKEKLETDHILPFIKFPEWRFEINNGRTLCQSCHRKTNTYGIKSTKKYELSHL